MQELIARAKELLADGTVARVLGWRAGDMPYNPEPAFFDDADALSDFVYNGFCGANLSKYMIEASTLEGKTLVCLKPCDTYSFNQLLNEHRIDREKAYIIGVDCGFLRLPTHPDIETIFLEQDKLLAVLPENHYLADKEKVSVSDLCNEPFMLLEKGAKAEISEIFEKSGLTPKTHFTTWDDYAVMSMVESGLGISILPELILKRVPYKIVAKELDIPAYRNIGLAMRDKKTVSLAVKKFIEYLQYR